MLLKTLFGHYRRHPLQALFLIIAIIVANVLLAGTLLINAQARASYGEGEQYLGVAPTAQIRHKEGGREIDERDYVRLRRQGFDNLAPLLRQIVKTKNTQPLELLGIDVFAMPRKSPLINTGSGAESSGPNAIKFAFPPYELWAAPARLSQLGALNDERIELASGDLLPPSRAIASEQLGHRILVDIGALQMLTGTGGRLSSILVFGAPPETLQELKRVIPAHMEYVSENETPDPAELTQSFHMNLAAMGLLAFVVGVFLIYNALAFSYTDRRDLIRKLRLAGLTRIELARALLLELGIFLVAGTLVGSWLGAQLAAGLLPGVGQTLAQLYEVYISYPDGLVPQGVLLPLLMTVIAAGFCVLFPLRETLNAPILERRVAAWHQHSVLQRDRLMAGIGLVLLLAALTTGLSTVQLWTALAGMACLLLGAALLLPAVLRSMISGLEKLVAPKRARLRWLLADTRWLLGPASLALMAMTLALVANSGLNTMILSFRAATDDWLSQRLAANLYLRDVHKVAELENWLASEMPQLTLAERYSKTLTSQSPAGRPVAIEAVNLQDGERFQKGIKLILGVQDAPARFINGEGIYISERAWRIDGWQAGSSLQLCDQHANMPILGVYHDYGNPKSQWMLSRQLFRDCWPQQLPGGLAVHGPDDTDWNQVRLAITAEFGLEDGEIINQAELKKAGLAIFDRTFAVTRALNALTLLVAAIGIFCAISAIHHHRVGQQALLSSLGMSRLERGSMLLLQWGLLGLLCTLLVWPLGFALAGYLAAVVTPAAFGWSFPLKADFHHFLVIAALAAGCLVMAVVLPSLRLLKTSPAAMLREQNL